PVCHLSLLPPCPSPHYSSFFCCMLRPPPSSTLFPYTTLFRSLRPPRPSSCTPGMGSSRSPRTWRSCAPRPDSPGWAPHRRRWPRSEEHTSELQSRFDLVCRLLLEKKKKITPN